LSKLILIGPALLLVGATAADYWSYRRASGEAETAMASIASRIKAPKALFDERMLEGLPEIAQRYFRHAIAPATPLHTTVRLEMSGTFLLGDKARYQTFAMTAHQILAPPAEFVWIVNRRAKLTPDRRPILTPS
jgi:hypothetical protein